MSERFYGAGSCLIYLYFCTKNNMTCKKMALKEIKMINDKFASLILVKGVG